MSLSIPNHLIETVLIPLRDAGYVIAPDGNGNYSAVPSATKRAAENRAFRLTLPDVAKQIDSYMKGAA